MGVIALASTPGASRAHEGERSEECPASSPKFRVGHTIKSLNVPGTLGETRPIQVHVWYPARGQDDCDEAADFEQGPGRCHAPAAVYTSRLYGLGSPSFPQWPPQWLPLSWTTVSSKASENARVARGDERFPVIIFSHGNQNNAIDYAFTLEALASYGYVVAAPDHLNNTQDDVRIDFVNTQAGKTVIPCLDSLPGPCSRGATPATVPKSMVDRYHDVRAVLDALPSPIWFGPRVDMDRVGIMGHSRGTVTSLVLAGGSDLWGLSADKRIKALMGLAIGNATVTSGANAQNVTVPALLVGGTLDRNGPLLVSQAAFAKLRSTDKQLVVIQSGVHRHFDSAYCAQMQSAGSIAQANSNAVLDLQTVTQILVSALSGIAPDYCALDYFEQPINITPIVNSITGFTVETTPPNVPTTGLTTDTVKEQVISLAVSFFGRVLNRGDGDDRPFTDCLPDEFKNQPPLPDPTQQDLNDAAVHADDSD
jgi:predicted dienelactone hydrolase